MKVKELIEELQKHDLEKIVVVPGYEGGYDEISGVGEIRLKYNAHTEWYYGMKTISLTDEAYERLKSWKSPECDSFSKVVLEVIPKRGTAADMEKAFQSLKPLTEEEAKRIEDDMGWANSWDNVSDTWSSLATGEKHAS